MVEKELRERLDRVYRRVSSDPRFATGGRFDLPDDRVMGVQVRDVLDIVGDMDLMDVYDMMSVMMGNYIPPDTSLDDLEEGGD